MDLYRCAVWSIDLQVRPGPRFEESRMIGTMDRNEGKDVHNGRQRREKGQGQESETEEKQKGTKRKKEI